MTLDEAVVELDRRKIMILTAGGVNDPTSPDETVAFAQRHGVAQAVGLLLCSLRVDVDPTELTRLATERGIEYAWEGDGRTAWMDGFLLGSLLAKQP